MWPFARWGRWQRKRQRNIDRALIFPAIRAQAKSWESGTIAILEHVKRDPAWRVTSEWEGEALELPDDMEKSR